MQLSLFSISYAGLWGQASLDLPGFIRHAAELGYKSVMLAGKRPHLSMLDASQARLDSIKDSLKSAGLSCPVLAAYTDFGAQIASEVPLLEMQIAYIESLCRVASVLGSKYVRVFTAYEADGQSLSAIWNRTVVALREIADCAADHNVTIAIQNHHDMAVHTTALLELLTDIDRPNCKLGFDAWSPALRGEDVYETAKLVAPHTAITTNADYICLPRFRYRPDFVNYERALPDMMRAVPLGAGVIDYPRFFQGLRDGGFDGVATYEICSPVRGGGSLENLDTCARHYLTWMREHGFG